MRIHDMEVHNYRNLDGITINFDQEINFIVGENELGKSNLLALFDAIFNFHQFSHDDFFKKSEPIKILLRISLSEIEKGAFEDYFDPSNSECIKLVAIQEYSDYDEYITFYWGDTENIDPVMIPNTFVKRINYLYYDSVRSPQQELTFYKGRGSGKFLSYLLTQYSDEAKLIDIDEIIFPIIRDVQNVFNRLEPLKRQGLGLFTDNENTTDFISRVLKLNGQDGYDIQKSGQGVQFSTLLLLTILERLVELKQNKRFRQFEEDREWFTEDEFNIFTELYFSDPIIETIIKPIINHRGNHIYLEIDKLSNDDCTKLGDNIINHIKIRKHISLVLGLDEPEIHLHPYMQRSHINYIFRLINNKDQGFLFLLKQLFDIDALDGQLIIVSHSPAILFDQYRHIVRFYKDTVVHAISGSILRFNQTQEKHLLLNFSQIKESFFSRCVILVEGETEYGTIPLWAGKIIGGLDDLGVTVIKVGGLNSIPHVANLLNNYNIPNLSIIDKDDTNDTNPIYISIPNLRTTIKRDFEEELFETILLNDPKLTVFFNVVDNYAELKLDKRIKQNKLLQISTKYKIEKTWNTQKSEYSFNELLGVSDNNLRKAMFLSWMDIEKTIIFGRFLGDIIEIDDIPKIYKDLITESHRMVQR